MADIPADSPPATAPRASGDTLDSHTIDSHTIDSHTIDHVEVLAAEGAGLLSVMRDGPWDARIPAIADWDLLALADHIGGAWRWAARIVKERLVAPVTYDSETAMTPDVVMGYLETALVDVLDALRGCPEDIEIWGFGQRPRTVRFWKRREAIETLVHRVDAEQATGELSPIDPAVAADGVGEFVDVLLPRLYRTRKRPNGAIEVVATDTGDRWIHGDPADGVGTLTGTAEDLLLALWRRRPASVLAHGGNPGVLAGWWGLGSI